jgi:NAD(P)-dependent dehydrogenase (short-subunit alcohol dehydrogenase family)
MKEFRDRVAVVTGAASGMGRAMADRFAAEGMRVVLADVEEEPLQHAERVLTDAGANVIAVRADVSSLADVQALAQKTLDAFGAVHIVCNNAGVGAGGFSWEQTESDWEWVLGVNLWGVIHGIRTFVPIMLEQDTEGHIVSTASVAGLIAGPFMSSYNVSKFGVVALSETLHHELAMRQSKIKVSVLCPGLVNTRISESSRNRPEHLANAAIDVTTLQNAPIGGPSLAERLKTEGLPPSEVAEQVLEAIREEQLYIITDHRFDDMIRQRMEDVVERRNPEPRRVV